MSYREFAAEVDLVARGLLALGIGPGEHVAIWATNVPQWVILQFATARIGAVLVNINPAYRPFELRYVLKQSDAVALFLVEQFKTSNYYAMLAEICPELATYRAGQAAQRRVSAPALGRGAGGDSAGRGHHLVGPSPARPSVPPERLDEIGRQLKADQPINIQYTSGTTGFPKAAMLSHRNLLLNAFYVGQCQRFTDADRICIPVPFYHCFGCVLGTLCAVVYGAAMIVPAESFNPLATLDAIQQERATAVYGVPTMYIAQLQEPSFDARDLSSLRTGHHVGQPLPDRNHEASRRPHGHRSRSQSPTDKPRPRPVITQTRADDPLQVRVETVGRPLPGVEVNIVDPGTGQALADNEQGELVARGHLVMLGYYKNPEATSAAIDAEGWLHTGDLGVRLLQRLLPHHGPDQRHGDPRRRKHLPARDRGVLVHAPAGRTSVGGRRARQKVRRGTLCLG